MTDKVTELTDNLLKKTQSAEKIVHTPVRETRSVRAGNHTPRTEPLLNVPPRYLRRRSLPENDEEKDEVDKGRPSLQRTRLNSKPTEATSKPTGIPTPRREAITEARRQIIQAMIAVMLAETEGTCMARARLESLSMAEIHRIDSFTFNVVMDDLVQRGALLVEEDIVYTTV